MLLLFAAITVLGGCHKKEAHPSPTPAASVSIENQPLKVSYSKGHLETLVDVLPLEGVLSVDQSVKVPARVGGQIRSLNVAVGDRVSAGQVIATLDTNEARLEVAKAQAQLSQDLAGLGLDSPSDKLRSKEEIPDVVKAKATLDNAKLNYERYKELHQEHLVSDLEFSDKETAYVTAKADYQAALETASQDLASLEVSRLNVAISKNQINDSYIVAPVSGVVDEMTAAVGSYINVGGDSGIVILKDRPLYVNIDVPQQHLSRFHRGSIISFTTLAYENQKLTARVEQVGGRVNPDNSGLSARAVVLDPPNWLYPGMAANVKLDTGTEPDRLLVPQAAVLTQAGKSHVFIVSSTDNGLAVIKEVPVKTGPISGDWITVEGPVEPQDQFITSDLFSLEEGTKVALGDELKLDPPGSEVLE